MVHAIGSLGGTISHLVITTDLVSAGSSVAGVQALVRINTLASAMMVLKINLCKVSAPCHAQPYDCDEDQAEHNGCRTHVLGSAG